ncbi:Fibronectin type III domain protein [Chthoniobacter flavus Ellin428]|uniref:Fibronectin type III domain protein n=1 Tax=Chthoniobacter flavus Ellin428 TaxID=497964 RepID=B4D327_9BACT|nr:right-handed parallel beta-helix repeat-containing protein [Chthoniobacter flavus]EDY19138.1 Fibronectin type III domain protein [Chthoniobacter flavus Ellin428]TCO87986.1 purple acid phosphatase-like protein [Chthoniobacter flavus]
MKALLLLFTLGASLQAAEYFTARNGNDAADGRSEKTAFATVSKGVSTLQPGDTLTVLPGTYFETVTAKISGTPEAPITIRAQRPGTVLLRGDVDAPAFRLVEGMKRTYVADFKPRVEGIAERSALRLYEPLSSAAEVERTNATYYQDDAAGRVYVHTSDSAPPDGRALALSVTNGFGILLVAPTGTKTVHDVVVDGLSFTGYQSREFPTEPGSRNRWGLAVVNGERVTVRRCSSFLNSGGIYLLAPIHCLVEDCHAFANISRFQVVGNNIIGWGVSETTFRRNVVEAIWGAGASAGDITFYGGPARKDISPLGTMEDNVAINAGIMIKGSAEGSEQHRNASVGAIAYYYQKPDTTNVLLRDFENAQAQQTYADPLNHDFRLQADAPASGAANVFFVSPTGDDAAAGNALKTAWRTLAHAAKTAQAGDTIYVTAGEYHETLAPAQSGTAEKPIRFARRGHDCVILDGGGKLPVGVDLKERSHVTVTGFVVRNFARASIEAQGGEAVRMENMIVTGSAGDGVSLALTREAIFTHNLIRHCRGADLRLANCPLATVTANIFEAGKEARLQCDAASLTELWSDANAFPPASGSSPLVVAAGKSYASLSAWQKATAQDPGSITAAEKYRDASAEPADFALRTDSPLIGRAPDASAIGPFLRLHVDRPLPVEDLTLHDTGAATATVEWSTPTRRAESTLEWGEDPTCPNKVTSSATVFHTVSLTNLHPGTKYYYRVSSPKPEGELVFASYAVSSSAAAAAAAPPPQSFQTAAQPAAPRTFHVATTGDDHHSGLSEADAFRTVAHAAELARAGDTVLIHAGTYEETVVIRSSGSEVAPITFRSAPGETVWMDGSNRFRSTAFRMADKHYITIDGLHFHHFRYAPDLSPIIQINGGSHLTIRRCFHDGREISGYVPAFVIAVETENLTLENDVMINGMGEGLTAFRCPDLTVRHCVFYNNFIRALTVLQYTPKRALNLSHNLFCDNLPQKYNNSLLRVSPLASLHSDDNVYFARLKAADRHLVETNDIHGKTVGHQGQGQYYGENLMLADVQKLAEQEKNSRFGNPGIRVAPELLAANAAQMEWQKVELHWDGKQFAPLDFADFMSDGNTPIAHAADGEANGLDPRAFSASAQ